MKTPIKTSIKVQINIGTVSIMSIKCQELFLMILHLNLIFLYLVLLFYRNVVLFIILIFKIPFCFVFLESQVLPVIQVVILYLPLTNLKVQRAVPLQFLFKVKYRNSFSYWQKVALNFSKPLKLINNNFVIHRTNPRQFIVSYCDVQLN